MKRIFLNVLSVMLLFIALPAIAQDVEYTLNPTVLPKSMSEVEKGAKVVLDFNGIEVSVADDAVVTATPLKEVDDGYDVTYEPDGEAISLPIAVGSDGNVFFRFDVDGTAGTLYELKLARGVVTSTDGTKANMVKTWKYFVAKEVAYNLNPTVTPKSMSEVMQGAKVTLSFGDTQVALTDDAVVTATPMTEVEDGYDIEIVYGDPVSLPLYLDNDGNACFNFDVRGAAGTQYELKLARGIIVSEDGTQANMVKTWKYFVAEATSYMEVKTINPGNAKVQTLSSLITINFYSQPETLATDAKAELINIETGKTYIGTISIPEYQEKVVKVRFDYGEDADTNGELCVPGNYTMTIAEGEITDNDGCINAEITATWIVSGPIDINDIEYLSVLPQNESSLIALSSITINFPDSPVLTKKLGAAIEVGDNYYDFNLQNNVLTLTLTQDLAEDGIYKVTLPAGSVYSLETGHGNKAIELTYYKVTEGQIETLLNGEETATVYNCQGVCILRNATSDDLLKLAPGFYIVNGKKILRK